MKHYEFTAGPEDEGRRVDAFLASRMPGKASRTEIQKTLLEHGVCLNGAAVKKNNLILKPGDKLTLDWEAQVEAPPAGEKTELRIIHEDQHIVVIDKPAGMVVHPAPGHKTGTLVNALIGSGRPLAARSGDKSRPGIVHRLDKDTSGLLIVAKTDVAHRKIAQQLESRTIEKHYTALVEGRVEFEEGRIELPIGRHPRIRALMAVRIDGKGREALTEYKILGRFRHSTLLDVRIHTGRTHQIRVHFSHMGHPVVGDVTYGSRVAWEGRLALHATTLEFEHPAPGKKMVRYESPLPEVFVKLIEKEKKR